MNILQMAESGKTITASPAGNPVFVMPSFVPLVAQKPKPSPAAVAGLSPCKSCNHEKFWVDAYEAFRCFNCEPPAIAQLVRRFAISGDPLLGKSFPLVKHDPFKFGSEDVVKKIHPDSIAWPTQAAAFCLTLTPARMPTQPSVYGRECVAVDPGRYLSHLKGEIVTGEASPRSTYGSLQREIVYWHDFFNPDSISV